MAASIAVDSSSKRRRISSDNAHQETKTISLACLPVLTHVASYLAAPSRALFDLALHGLHTKPSATENSIIGRPDEWGTLDLGDIEKDLAARLSDDDINAVLLCVNAVSTVKKLRLTDCIKITGKGLAPLSGSLVIEQIDLSLVGDRQSTILDPKPKISFDCVLPILDSIVAKEGCVLKHLRYPQVWNNKLGLEAFISRYDQMFCNREIVTCLKCKQIIPPGEFSSILQCDDCLNHYCILCSGGDDDGMDDAMLKSCDHCEKNRCFYCQRMEFCFGCNNMFCLDCKSFSDCLVCDLTMCNSCTTAETDMCDECMAASCGANELD